MALSSEGLPGKLIVDSLHGDIHLLPKEWAILDTAAFQRLRRLKQLQMGQVTYPNATHTRFAHSIGALGVMARIVSAIRQTLDDRQVENLRMAALLHDIGHYPYSHLMEWLENVSLTDELAGDKPSQGSYNAGHAGYPKHEELGRAIVMSDPALLEAIGGVERATEVADIFTRSQAADSQWSKLVHSSLDMDRLDYLPRDSQAAGVPYGNIDANYLLNSLKISPTRMLGVTEKALPAAEQYLLARFFMHKTVYYHKTTFGIEEACRQLLRRMRDAGRFELPADGPAVLKLVQSPRLMEFTDEYVDRLIHRAMGEGDDVMRALARCIANRRPPKLLYEVQVLGEDSRSSHNRGMFFWAQAKVALKPLADKFGIPLGQFLLCQTKPLRLEPRGSRLTAQQARDISTEREDELIKVFVKSDPEPKSLVDIEHSLINVCGNYFWQAFRLYVVYEGLDSNVIERLRGEARAWDSSA